MVQPTREHQGLPRSSCNGSETLELRVNALQRTWEGQVGSSFPPCIMIQKPYPQLAPGPLMINRQTEHNGSIALREDSAGALGVI